MAGLMSRTRKVSPSVGVGVRGRHSVAAKWQGAQGEMIRIRIWSGGQRAAGGPPARRDGVTLAGVTPSTSGGVALWGPGLDWRDDRVMETKDMRGICPLDVPV
jgi:hypothetical protein